MRSCLVFTTQCYAERSIPIVCHPSIYNVVGLRSRRLEFFQNNFAVSLGCSLSAYPNIMDLRQEKRPEILARIGVGCGKSGSRHTKALISQKHGKI